MKREGVPDIRSVISQTFFTITNLMYFGNTEIKFLLLSNISVCFLSWKVCFMRLGSMLLTLSIQRYLNLLTSVLTLPDFLRTSSAVEL